VETIDIDGESWNLVKLRETFESDTYIWIPVDALTPHEVIEINGRKVFMNLL
jgi:hypothetical protein